MHLPGRDVPWKQFFRDLLREIDSDNLLDYAGAVAFSGFLAIFPFLLFAVALAGLVIDPKTLATLVEHIESVAPPQVAHILTRRLHALTAGTAPGLLTVGALGAIWAASGAVASLMTALDNAYDVRDSRPFWKKRGIAVLITLAGAVLFIVASLLLIAAPAVASALGDVAGTILLWLRWPVAAAIMLLVVACLYYFLPDVEQRFRFITPGSVVAVLLWILASLGFSLYVGHFGRYEVVYGALGGVIVLLLWMWISAIVILLGAEINAILEQYSPEGKRVGAKSLADAGPDAPGDRGGRSG
jgi:membrane protein